MPIFSTDGHAIACPSCGSNNLIRNGSNRYGERYRCRDCNSYCSERTAVYADPSMLEEGVRLAKQNQRLQDRNRVERKKFREYARIENAAIALNEQLIAVLEGHSFRMTLDPVTPDAGAIGVVQLSDIHFNELIDIPGNKYDFTIASQRLQKHAAACVHEFKNAGVKRVIIASTGDLMNSDRRLDEITVAANNRVNATILAVEILQQFIRDFARHWHVDFLWVCGNEGRINPEMGYNTFMASDNYDHMIPMILNELFTDVETVQFHAPENPMEKVVELNGLNFLLLHGHGGVKGQPADAAAKIRAKYAERGITIDYMIWGHIHEAYISELFARSGSPAGGNAFSTNALSLMGKASQNCYVITESGEISGKMIPLQKYDGYPGYDFEHSLAAYNTKSADKTRPHTSILQITI